eukprot:3614350-Amphidinium_carterae.1
MVCTARNDIWRASGAAQLADAGSGSSAASTTSEEREGSGTSQGLETMSKSETEVCPSPSRDRKRRSHSDGIVSLSPCPKLPRGWKGLEPCSPEKVGVDPVSLEDHRQRNRWQSTKGVLAGVAEVILAGNRVAYMDLMGNADVEHGTRMKPITLFRCFSMTKPITAVAMARLVEQKRVSWDDAVYKFIPSFRHMKVVKAQHAKDWAVPADADYLEPARRTMTLRHLLTHTSGLAYGPDRVSPAKPLIASSPEERSYLGLVRDVDEGRITSLESFCDSLALLPLRFHPGGAWMYSH